MPLALLVIVTFILAGCSAGTKTTTANLTTTTPKTIASSQTAATSRPHPPVRTGDINTGPKVEVATQSIDSAGGIIAVSKAGDPLDGLVIDVPPQSYSDSRSFKVSYAPVTNQTFGADITPISPMIYVDNGGTYSDELLYVRVPVKIPADYFAMGFLYDETTKQLEGMPLVAADSDSITVATRHFSNFLISMIAKASLKKDIDSGFRPGIDDWQFDNLGSYITPKGECEGQSLTALWYYCAQPAGANARLYGRYDNNGNQPATPSLWQDDSWGYRFASVVQEDIDASSFANLMWERLSGKDIEQDKNGKWQPVDVPGIGDEATWDLFAYSMKVTKEPQLVCIEDDNGGGHAMICYEISNGNLL